MRIAKEDADYILKNYLSKCSKEIAEELGISRSSVLKYKRLNNLKVPKELVNKWKSQNRKSNWTAEMDQFLRDNYLTMPVKKMSKALGFKSDTTAFGRMKKLGLNVPEEIRQKWKMQGLEKGFGWNKGKKQVDYMAPDQIEATKKTRFKKGNLPHNTREDGDLTIRSDGYVWVRLAVAKWELLHRVIYMQHHNESLSSTDNIIFKDGNRSNFDIDNLEKISHEELMARNTIQRYPEDLKRAIRALAKLKRTIKKHEKQD